MPELFEQADSLPIVVADRRRCRDRRSSWRGGRRDSDWINRPLDSLARIARAQDRATGWWRRIFVR